MRRSQLTIRNRRNAECHYTRTGGGWEKGGIGRDDDRTEEQLEISGRIPRLRALHEICIYPGILDFPYR